MNARFITYVIIGVAFGFTQLWFVYWVVKLFKEKQRILAARRAGGSAAAPAAATGQGVGGGEAEEGTVRASKRAPRPPRKADGRR